MAIFHPFTSVNSPGYLPGAHRREEAGLVGGPGRVITDKMIFGFNPESKKMMLLSIHPGNTLDDVINTMGFMPEVPNIVPFTEVPSSEQLQLIREQIDPNKMYMGKI